MEPAEDVDVNYALKIGLCNPKMLLNSLNLSCATNATLPTHVLWTKLYNGVATINLRVGGRNLTQWWSVRMYDVQSRITLAEREQFSAAV